MPASILATKLYIPPPRPRRVLRPRLIARLNAGLERPLTLVSAPAGFGKTTLVSEWVAGCGRPAAWLSLDEGENDPARFLAYLVAALQTIFPAVAQGLPAVLQSPQPPPAESILTTLLNELSALPGEFVLVLDDYHVIDARPVDALFAFLVEHLPPPLHLVVATREDPDLPLARLRARGALAELRAADLRFTLDEAAGFLSGVMGLDLTADDVAALENRTEGWIAGLQLAALSLQGQPDTAQFVRSFAGSHRYVLDYLVEEVLRRQPAAIQSFLLQTSVLERLCGPLCDAVLRDPATSGQATLEYLERANLFIVPLDDERRWYRYHRLFADLLRQRLQSGAAGGRVSELHIRASQWYEDNGLDIEAFQHAAAAGDVERAERLMDGRGIPLHYRGAVMVLLDWLGSLPEAVLNARPSLWWRYGALLLVAGQTTGVQEKLDAAEAAVAEAALQGAAPDGETRHLRGRIAAARAVLALTRYQPETMLAESRRALECLRPESLGLRANAYWTLGYGYLFQGDRVPAREALAQGVALSQAAGDVFTLILATIGLANIEEAENRLYPAAEIYRRILQWAGDQPLQIVYEAHLGLARIHYEWNDLDAAEQYGRQALRLARQYDRVIDRFILCEVFLARLQLARGDVSGAAATLAQAGHAARRRNFVFRLPDVAAAQVPVLLRQGNVAAAAQLAQAHALPAGLARVHLAQGDPAAALAVLAGWRRHAEARGWADERLKALVLEAVALRARGDDDDARERLAEAVTLAEPGGFIRLFVDEGPALAEPLSAAAARGIAPDYVARLLAALDAERPPAPGADAAAGSLIEPLSERELEILRLIAQGLSNREIGARLFLALDTVKGHNRRIFDKLQVQRRTEAVARARELGLL